MPLMGVYRGMVTDAADPQRSGRVRVQVPSIGMSSEWAPVCLPPGSGAGAFVVGSTVVVAFENGDQRFPIVLGRLK